MANKVLVVLDGEYLVKNEESKTMVDLLDKLDILYCIPTLKQSI